LIVFDGAHFSKGAFSYACKINETSPILLTGIFVPSIDYTNIMMYYVGGLSGPLYVPTLDTNPTDMEQNVETFKKLCLENNIEYRVHTSIEGTIVNGIKKETRYADLLILGSELFYSNIDQSTQEDYLEGTLHLAECPVLLVPETYNFPQNLILAYDGSRSSVFAIKQFAYLFSSMTWQDTLIVHASAVEGELPDLPYIEEFAARHFTNPTFFELEAEPKDDFATWIGDRDSAMLVTGSYGRSSFSEMFRKSFVRQLIKEHKLPIFITHI